MLLVVGSFSVVGVPFTYADLLFSEGFESDSEFTGWTQTSPTEWDVINNASGANSGSKRAQVSGAATGDVISMAISTSGFDNISLSFWYKINQALESTDHFLVEWSTDGSSWTTEQDLTSLSVSGGYLQSTLALGSSVANQSNFQLRFLANLGASSDVVSIDDVELTGSTIASVSSPPVSSEPATVR